MGVRRGRDTPQVRQRLGQNVSRPSGCRLTTPRRGARLERVNCRRLAPFLTSLATLGLVSSLAPAAHACGGCFGFGSSNAPVVGHRMAFALSEGRTVLWDQFEYSGAPEEFSWVLPIAPGAYLEQSSDAWFEALEAYTQVTVTPPPLNCTSRGGDGCGSFASADSASAFESPSGLPSEPSVSVLRRQTVGPYDTVTLRSTSGDALSAWLVDNGFVIPDDIRPIILAYVSEGADFIALRLRPGAGVTQMTPVRVVTPEGPAVLPLRMVAAGIGQSVDIVLYLIGEARYAMPDLLEVEADLDALSFDFARGTSNYLELQQRALARNDGHVFLTAYAAQGDFGTRGGRGWSTTEGRGFASDLISLYFQQAIENTGDLYVGACDGVARVANTDRRVVACPGDGSPCPISADELAANEFVCEQFDDVAAALTGQRPRSTWLTRLELRLPREALTIDCVVEPNFDQSYVQSAITAQRLTNPPCDLPLFSSSLSEASPRFFGVYLLAAATLGVFLRRVGRRRE
jgi:hypothetical protein